MDPGEEEQPSSPLDVSAGASPNPQHDRQIPRLYLLLRPAARRPVSYFAQPAAPPPPSPLLCPVRRVRRARVINSST